MHLEKWIVQNLQGKQLKIEDNKNRMGSGQTVSHADRDRCRLPVYLAFDNSGNPFVLEIPQIEPWPLRQVTSEQSIASSSADQSGNFNQQDSSLADGRSIEVIVPDGYYAISVNQLYEYPRRITDKDNSSYHLDTRPLKALRGMQPIGRAGLSICIYADFQLREAYRLAALGVVRESTD